MYICVYVSRLAPLTAKKEATRSPKATHCIKIKK